jgi:hypothetical protein
MQPNQQQTLVGRFRRRIDAEGHLRVLKQIVSDAEFAIVFESHKDAVSQEAVTQS